ncbi:MAG TPA: hypothetical protein VKP60_05255 [Magnetospirillaceae bacterium]|nr:hypothetical protein [Magnetospirillaceae bacterium]
MRFTLGFAVLGLVALAGCASPPNTATPAQAVTADAQDPTAAAVKKPKNCIVGTRVCTAEQQVDPSVQGMSGEALGDSQRGHPMGYSPH